MADEIRYGVNLVWDKGERLLKQSGVCEMKREGDGYWHHRGGGSHFKGLHSDAPLAWVKWVTGPEGNSGVNAPFLDHYDQSLVYVFKEEFTAKAYLNGLLVALNSELYFASSVFRNNLIKPN